MTSLRRAKKIARSAAELSKHMATIRKRDTRPEMVVRKMAWSLGYRYRLYRRDLPGTPDLVFPRRRKVIFVHGCFWHRHDCPAGRKMPAANLDYWGPKLARNVERDEKALSLLHGEGWETLTIWECELDDASRLRVRLRAFLG